MLRTEHIAISSCSLFLFFLIIWGMTGNSPLRPDGDEWFYVLPALRMAQNCTFDPLWLSHPASTTIYPILFYTHFLNALFFHGALFSNGVTVDNVMFDHIVLFCYWPRFLSAFAFIGCIPLIYGIGEAAFNKVAGVCAAFMLAITPNLVLLAQVVRSDCPALFFSYLAIYAIFKWLQTSSPKFHLLAAIATGLAMSSRYSALSLVPLLVLADAKMIFEAWRSKEALRSKIVLCLAGLVVAFVTFAITTPYLFLDFATFRQNMADEKGDLTLGRDGFNTVGNAQFYFTIGIPHILDPYVLELALLGLAIACFTKKRFAALLLACYPLIVLAGTSLHPCHDERYMFPTIPIFALFAASAITRFGSVLSFVLQRFIPRKIASTLSIAAVASLVIVLKADALHQIFKNNTASAYLGTEAQFYEWTKKNLPAGTAICCVGGWFSPHAERYKLKDVVSGPSFFDYYNHGKYISPADFYREGYKYFLVDGAWIQAYFNEPERYAMHCRFYKELWDNTEIVKQFTPHKVGVGTPYETDQTCPVITLYKYKPKH